MLQKEFIPWEEAMSLKVLGFDYPCLGSYSNKDTFNTGGIYYRVTPNQPSVCIAPLYQQTFEWFRENHKLIGSVIPLSSDPLGKVSHYGFDICSSLNDSNWEDDCGFKTYKEAELACLRKLLEIVRTK